MKFTSLVHISLHLMMTGTVYSSVLTSCISHRLFVCVCCGLQQHRMLILAQTLRISMRLGVLLLPPPRQVLRFLLPHKHHFSLHKQVHTHTVLMFIHLHFFFINISYLLTLQCVYTMYMSIMLQSVKTLFFCSSPLVWVEPCASLLPLIAYFLLI